MPGDNRVYKSALYLSRAKVRSRSGRVSTIHKVISSSPVTLLFFGSPLFQKSKELVDTLKNLQKQGQDIGRHLDIIYVPLFTFQETQKLVEEDFARYHGDWWMLPFQSRENLDGRYMHNVCVVPTVVVLDQEGSLITQCGQKDLHDIGQNVLTSWF